MKLNALLILAIAMAGITQACQSPEGEPSWDWQKVGGIPDLQHKDTPRGQAGVAAGVTNDRLVVAGGSNFPDAAPWDGGHKTYYDDIFLYAQPQDSLILQKNSYHLPYPVAYSANVSIPQGIVMAGGENASGAISTVLLLNWDTGSEKLKIDSLPSLPASLTAGAIAAAHDCLYFAGGQNADGVSDRLYVLDLNRQEKGWVHQGELPYPVTHTVLVSAEKGRALYLIGGRKGNPGGLSTLYKETYRYDIETAKWERKKDLPYALAAQTDVQWKSNSVLIFSGDRGETFHATEKLIAEIEAATDSIKRRKLMMEKDELQKNHPGFENQILYYDTNNDIWKNIGKIPFPGQVTTTAVNWEGEIIIPGGEIRAGIRTPDIIGGKPREHQEVK